MELRAAAGIGCPKLAGGALKVHSSSGAPFHTFNNIQNYDRNYHLDLKYLLHSKLDVGAGYEFLKSKATGTQYRCKLSPDRPFKIDLPVHGLFIPAEGKWQAPQKSAEAGIEWNRQNGEILLFL